MEFKRKKMKGAVVHFREENNIILGYTEKDSDVDTVKEFFGVDKAVQLDQIHGNKILFTSEVKDYPKGDGLILDEKKVMAVIRTADCTPLFFRSDNGKTAGVIHIGWRGLYSLIGINLLGILKKNGSKMNNYHFFTGPAIEGDCYTVQQDVADKFSGFSFGNNILKKTSEGYSLDVTKGIELCLIEQGVPKNNIHHSGICTLCDPRFPSYRGGDREKRIFNFIIRL
ncbi:MAG: polyphenol oxidase family protein [Acidobacteriota bacterium]